MQESIDVVWGALWWGYLSGLALVVLVIAIGKRRQ